MTKVILQRTVFTYSPWRSATTQRNKTDIKKQKVCCTRNFMVDSGLQNQADSQRCEPKSQQTERVLPLVKLFPFLFHIGKQLVSLTGCDVIHSVWHRTKVQPYSEVCPEHLLLLCFRPAWLQCFFLMKGDLF